MKFFRLKYVALTAAAGLVLTAAGSAGAAESGSFTSHYLVPEKPYDSYVESLPFEKKLEVREYLEYEQREPCQSYQPVPAGFVREGCAIRVKGKEPAVSAAPVKKEQNLKISNVIVDYEVHFPFDSAKIEPKAHEMLKKAAREVKRYEPREVVVAGHADTAGPADYNYALSQKRAEAVSQALTDMGVTNRVLEKKAYGEKKLAVETKDGVRLQENRRVVVEFRK